MTPTQRLILEALAAGATIRKEAGRYYYGGVWQTALVAERALRGLERRGWVQERPHRVGGGPQLWRYEITEAGRAAVAEPTP